MHEVSRFWDFYSLGVRQKIRELAQQCRMEHGWTSISANKQRAGTDAADIGCAKRREAGPKQLRDLGTLVLVQHSFAVVGHGFEPLFAEQGRTEDPSSILQISCTICLHRWL